MNESGLGLFIELKNRYSQNVNFLNLEKDEEY